MRAEKLDYGIFINNQCKHIVQINDSGFFISDHGNSNLNNDEYLKDLRKFLYKWYPDMAKLLPTEQDVPECECSCGLDLLKSNNLPSPTNIYGESIKQFLIWLQSLCRHSKDVYRNIFVTKFIDTETEKELRISIYTPKHKYYIGVKEYKDGRSYLYGDLANRAPDPGEEHLRFADLSDGKVTLETWAHILKDIVYHELDYVRSEPHLRPGKEKPISFKDVLRKYCL